MQSVITPNPASGRKPTVDDTSEVVLPPEVLAQLKHELKTPTTENAIQAATVQELNRALRSTNDEKVSVHVSQTASSVKEELRRHFLSGEELVVSPTGLQTEAPYKRYAVNKQRGSLDSLFANLHELSVLHQKGLPYKPMKLNLPIQILHAYATQSPDRLKNLHQILYTAADTGIVHEESCLQAMSLISTALAMAGEIEYRAA